MGVYMNRWVSSEALRILDAEEGRILDVGGGASPYWRAAHIMDLQPFTLSRLEASAWGRGRGNGAENAPGGAVWSIRDYTQFDLCCGERWPFNDQEFDLGLASHCLEDLREPLPSLRELCRVCRRVLVLAPARLAEQCRGIDHPAYCGFAHHPWILFAEPSRVVFRRKTFILNLRSCHIPVPLGMRLKVEFGSWHVEGSKLEAEERVYWDEKEDFDDYASFIRPYRRRQDLFEVDRGPGCVRRFVWNLKQRVLGVV